MFCFGHHTQNWMLYQLDFSSDFQAHLTLPLAPLVMKYHSHSNRNMECGSNSSVLPHCSLNHNGLTSTGAIALARALQHNNSLEVLKWVLNNTWYLYKFFHSVRCMIISTIHTPPTLLTLYLCSLHALILEHSLEGNKAGNSGAFALADTLRVNQSLKTLK